MITFIFIFQSMVIFMYRSYYEIDSISSSLYPLPIRLNVSCPFRDIKNPSHSNIFDNYRQYQVDDTRGRREFNMAHLNGM